MIRIPGNVEIRKSGLRGPAPRLSHSSMEQFRVGEALDPLGFDASEAIKVSENDKRIPKMILFSEPRGGS